MDGDRMIAMETVYDALDLPSRNGRHNVPWRRCVVCLAWGMLVNRLEINYPAWGAIVLGCYDHPTGPGIRGVDRDRFKHT